MPDIKDINIPKDLEEILLDFTVNVLEEKPDDIIDHAASYFNRLKREKEGRQNLTDETEDTESLVSNVSKMLGPRSVRRLGIFDFQYPVSGSDESDAELFPKSKEEQQRIRSRVKDIFLLNHLDQESLQVVIDAMEPIDVKKDDTIIQQGDEGDYFYVVDHGTFNCFKIDEEGREKYLMTYKDSGSFGELALIHNEPRAASVQASTDGRLWRVSRETFKRLVIRKEYKKQKMCIQLLDQVPELKPLTEEQKLQVCDALEMLELKQGDVLFRQGEVGNGMYFIYSGTVSILKDSGKGEKLVNTLTDGEFFGEMALINKEPRNATVKAETDCHLAFLDIDAFERLLGPCMDILKEHMEDYKKLKKAK